MTWTGVFYMSKLTTALERVLMPVDAPVAYDHGRWFTAQDLSGHVAQVRGWLDHANVGQGDFVFLAMPNSYAFVVMYVAILMHGAVAAPLNPAMPASELARTLGRCNATAALISTEIDADWDSALTADQYVRDDRHSRGWGLEACGQLWMHRDVAESAGAGSRGPVTLPDDAPAVLMFTSGTTGEPKRVLLLHRHVMTAAANVAESHRLSADDVTYCMLPLFHINAQVIVLLSTLVSHGRVVMAPRFHASRFWDELQQHHVTWVSCVPAILSILVKAETEVQPASSLRFVRSASAPLSPVILRKFEERFQVPVIEAYGMTEAAGQICTNPIPPGERKLGSVGLPAHVDLTILDEQGNEKPVGHSGEIAIRGESVIEAYANPDGVVPPQAGEVAWLRTGDIGYRDADGYVFIVGRAKEIINRAGEKFSPREVEDILQGHDIVDRVAVVGVPDATYGERAVAWVVPRPGLAITEDEVREKLLKLCKGMLAAYKWPSEIRCVAALPTGSTGKILKRDLQMTAVSE